jgi:hypothetical protein
MQYVNDDMDELFKRAAEDYPLDTSNADWNKVLAALQGEAGTNSISEKKKGNKNGRLLWLLLLLPLGLICNQLYSPGALNNTSALNSKGTTKAVVQNETPATENDGQQNNNRNKTANEITATTNAGEKNISAKNETVDFSNFSIAQIQKKSSRSAIDYLKFSGKTNTAKKGFASDDFKSQSSNGDFSSDEILFQRRYVSGIAFSKILDDVPPNMLNRKFDPLINTSEENLKQPVHVSRRKKFYVGLMGGVDVTTIKFQKVENAGKSYGVLVGYQFNKKWSVEAGSFIERKYYYTEGKYFNASKIYRPMPANYWIDNVSGNCKMIEVPVSLRYNFSTHKNSTWFATVGASSYFMKKESYVYDYYYGSSTSYGRHEKDFTNGTKNLFSNIGVSAGYTHRLGNFADLRVEPYLKVPVSKMGSVGLPLFSTGLQVGLSRKF